jgi:hypothetical protein
MKKKRFFPWSSAKAKLSFVFFVGYRENGDVVSFIYAMLFRKRCPIRPYLQCDRDGI